MLLNLCGAAESWEEIVVKTIEVYIMNKEVITQTAIEGRPLAAGGGVHYCTVKEVAKTEKIVSNEDKAAIQLVEALVAGKGLKIRIIDMASFKGKVKARLKGVKTTPIIIVGNNRIVGVPKKRELSAILSR